MLLDIKENKGLHKIKKVVNKIKIYYLTRPDRQKSIGCQPRQHSFSFSMFVCKQN